MLNLRVLLFLFAALMFCVVARKNRTAQRKVKERIGDEETISKTKFFLDAYKSKNKTRPDSDNDRIRNPEFQSTESDDGKDKERPTCLMCVCLSGSVYCEEVTPDMTSVPPLPRETTYLYARFNKITRITNPDFADAATLRRIDLSGNLISEIEDGAFSKLEQLRELTLSENKLVKLPVLPGKLLTLSANHNLLRTTGLKATLFKKLSKLSYLYLGDNLLEAVPALPESLRVVHLNNNNITTLTDETFCRGNGSRYIRYNLLQVRLDGNPINLSQHPDSFVCLRALPIGHY